MSLETYQDFTNSYLLSIFSALVFYGNNRWILPRFVPKNARHSKKSEWEWINIANSLIHSFITGMWALFCFWQVPDMRQDLISTYSFSAHMCMCLSNGYFIYDFIDMANHWEEGGFEILFHHIVVLIGYTVPLSSLKYMGITLVGLLIEVNSIFLHLRTLMKLAKADTKSISYHVNNVVNLGTFVLFRILTLGWMTRWVVLNREHKDMTKTAFYIASALCSIIMVMNVVLLHRILADDFKTNKKQPQINNKQTSHAKIQ
ncbi:unnamed protein product [Bemisia tabaci]|uniref:TLC domain-containing protein n=1 Tax=Bemisia tabaci TaxID=7038 RepID=A0A9P0AMX5_BEMTA|nr:PREDICTED: TLC domain-containing protein 2-like [Bemisia tabaci]CAH0394764.1 unnamed protein product [Bemisia tabaci]